MHIIWLHGLGDSGAGWHHLRNELGLRSVQYTFPDAPIQPVTCNGGMPMPSWMDLVKIPVEVQDPEDGPGLTASTATVHKIIDGVVEKGTPSDKIVLGGFSQGGGMALLAGYSYSKPLAGIVSFSGWAAQRDGFDKRVGEGANAKTPAFIGHGTMDEVVLPSCGEDSKNKLEALGVPVSYSTYMMPHSAHPSEFKALRAFVKEVLKLDE